VLALGLASVVLLVGTNWIRERLLGEDAALVRAGSEIQSRLATAHLWVEEYVSGDEVDLGEVTLHFDRSRRLVRGMLEGGEIGWARYSLAPVSDTDLRAQIVQIEQLARRFEEMSDERLEGYLKGADVGIGSRVEVAYDRVFYELLATVEGLNQTLGVRLAEAHDRSRLLFRIILAVWAVIVGLAVTGLWSRERSQRRAETALRDSEARFFEAQKMASIGRLAGGIAHDINNYLAAITAQSEVLRMKPRSQEELDEKVELIVQSAGRASRLIQRLLAFSRRMPVHREVLTLNAVIEEIATMLRRIIGEDVRLETRLDEDPWQVEIDPAQLEQVVLNLVVNAREAMPDGGVVRLETGNADFNDDYVRSHPVERPGSYAMLSISDTGVGVPQELQDQIFEPFFTTKEAGTSSGLGLASVYGIVRQNGGYIWLYSEPGHGATFKIYLPRSMGKATVLDKPTITEAVLPSEAGVLLVEDNEELRRATAELLEGHGLTVFEAPGGQEGLDLFEREQQSIDLVITDVVMQGMNGREMAEELKRRRDHLPVLYMSGYTADVMNRQGLGGAEVDFLEKPFSAKQLAEKLNRILASSGAGQAS
jgi:signal transduction histidine kinase/ActR/RegA family two-component response regulator